MSSDSILEQIQDCEDRSDDLSEWEASFIQSLSEQYSRKGSLTPRQEETLNKIWERVTSRKSGAIAKRGK